VWWPQLPEHVKWAFFLGGKTDRMFCPLKHSFGCLTFPPPVPSAIASWWLQWQEISPSEFPLPPSLRHFGPVKLNTSGRFIIDPSTCQESELSKAIREAWDILPDIIRQLMLFSWAGVQSVRLRRNDVAHPDLGKFTAKDILDRDFHNTFHKLHSAACRIADYLFDGVE